MNRIAILDNKAKRYLPIFAMTAGDAEFQTPVKRVKGAPFHHIFYVVSGEGVLETPEGDFRLKAGQAIFMRKGIPTHYYAVGEAFSTAWVTFVGKGAEDILTYYGAKNFAFLNDEDVLTRITGIIKMLDRGSTPDQVSQKTYGLVTYFFDKLKQDNTSNKLLRAKEYVDKNYFRDISVSDIAEHVGISESMIYRIFKEQGNTSPVEYIRHVRIFNAEKMLLNENKLSISEVAQACGFSDIAYFCKVFKSETGITPKKYQNTYNM